MNIFKLIGSIFIDTADSDKALQKTDKSAESLGRRFVDAAGKAGKFAATIGTAAVGAMGALAGASIKTGEEFSAMMSEVAALSKASEEDLAMMEKTAREYGASTKFSATEAAEAMKYMALAGWDAETSCRELGGVLNLAAASGMGLGEASDMVTDYLSAFSKSAMTAAEFSDKLAYAQAASNTSAQQLGEAYKNCAANLNGAGQDVETVTSILEAMANQGLKGSEAGTALNATMRDITKAMFSMKSEMEAAMMSEDGFASITGDLNDLIGMQAITVGKTMIPVADSAGQYRDLTDILKDVEKATSSMGDAEKAAALSSTFTSDSTKGLNLILNEGVEKIAGYEDALRNCSGSAEEMAKTMNDNLKGDLANMGSAFEELKLKVFDKIEKPARRAVQFITDKVIPVASDFVEKAVPVIESGLDAIGNAVDFLAGIIQEHMPQIQEIAGNVFSFISEAVENYVKPALQFAWEHIQYLAGVIQEHMPQIQEIAGNVFSFISEAVENYVKPALQFAWELFQYLASVAMEYFPVIRDIVVSVFSGIADIWNNNLKPCIDALIKCIKEELAPAFKFVFENIIRPIVDSVFKGIGELWEKSLKPILSGIIDYVKNIFAGDFTGAFESIGEILKGIFEGFQTLVKTPINAIIGMINKMISGLNTIKIPEWVPGIGGSGINLPEIPMLAKGGEITGAGTVLVGEKGPELLDLPAGARVTPLNKVAATADNRGVEEKLDQLIAIFKAGFGVTLNGDTIVGQMAPGIDKNMGRTVTYRERRN